MGIETVEELIRTVSAFRESRIILTAVELDIFSKVGSGTTSEKLTKEIGAKSARDVEILLNALTALGLLIKDGDIYRNTDFSENFLTSRSNLPLRESLLHSSHLWHSWSELTSIIIHGRKKRKRRSKEGASAFISAMQVSGMMRAPYLWDVIKPSSGTLLDVGGGSGIYSIEFVRRVPDGSATVLEVPEVAPITKRYLKASGVSSRVKVKVGDIFSARFKETYDFVLLSSLLHIYGGEENIKILRNCRNALKIGGKVIIHDFILEDSKTEPYQAVIFSVNMLVNTERGASHSKREYFEWLKEAGFTNPEFIPLKGPTSAITALKP